MDCMLVWTVVTPQNMVQLYRTILRLSMYQLQEYIVNCVQNFVLHVMP